MPFDIQWKTNLPAWRIYHVQMDQVAFQTPNDESCLSQWVTIMCNILPDRGLTNNDIMTIITSWLCLLYLAGIFSSSPVASTDHVCCDVSIKRLAAVAPLS